MKFVCDRCGKKYSTAEDPAPGKVYKLKCKACGHLVVVKGQAGTMTGIPAITAVELAVATAAQEPNPTPVPSPGSEVELHVEPELTPAESVATPLPGALAPAEEQAPEPVSDDAVEPLPMPSSSGPLPLPPEVALAVDGAARAAGAARSGPKVPPPELPEFELEPAPVLDPALIPPSPEKDELADFAAAAAEVMDAPLAGAEGDGDPKHGQRYVDLFGDATEQGSLATRSSIPDAFSVAARASLPDTFTGATPTGMAAEPAIPASRPAAAAPAIARPARKTGLGGTPIAIIGAGMFALVGITAYALFGRDNTTPPQAVAAPRPVPQVEPPRPLAPEIRPPEPVVEARPEPEKLPGPKVAERRPEPAPKVEARPRAPERRPEPKPKVAEKKPEPPPAPEPRTETREVNLPDATAALTQEVVNKVVGANRKAFTACITNASEGSIKLDGRRVALRITVNTNGTVTYPTLDDQSLNATEMGQCLKSAARLMIFPKFKGDPFHYEVPLILTGS